MKISLTYTVRGDAALRDLQKVWLCATPEDYRIYGRTITEDLLGCRDSVSVWQPLEPGQAAVGWELDALLDDLRQMQLFVVPVTRAFLTTDNRARLSEMRFAEENDIPVLPVFMEPGLDALFNSVCGSLQCLDRCSTDTTALPFRVKLASFLDDVLLDDELVNRIRQSFAASIFLSYRKKDREYAQEVMRLIHSSEYARDVAIWYDEFLTAGEDFNESIREALRKCDLVSMVVTPNFLEDPNYVKDQEYPMARKIGKPIMPVIAVPTDMAALKNGFEGLPECITADEDAAEAVERVIRSTLRIGQDDSPEHLFLMGLAYLNGIDVETDHDRALKLITEAAEGGVTEALSKLASMYSSGMGVRRDYTKAALWQQRYSDTLEAGIGENVWYSPDRSDDYYDTPLRYLNISTEEVSRYMHACREASDLWRLAGRNEDAWADIDRLMQLDKRALGADAITELIEIYMLAIRLAMNENELVIGRRLCDEMMALAEKKLFVESVRTDVHTLALEYRGLIALKENDPETALKILRECAEVFYKAIDWGFISDMGERRYAENRVPKIHYIETRYNIAFTLLKYWPDDPEKRSEARYDYQTVIDLYNQVGRDGAEDLRQGVWAGSWSGIAEIIRIEEGREKALEYSRDILAKAIRQYGILQSEATLMYLKAACASMAETLTGPEVQPEDPEMLAELFTVRKRQADLCRGENTGEAEKYDEMARAAMQRFAYKSWRLFERGEMEPLQNLYDKCKALQEKHPDDPYIRKVMRVTDMYPDIKK